MITFDATLPRLSRLFAQHRDGLGNSTIYVNRDLNGRVRLIVDAILQEQPIVTAALRELSHAMAANLGPHAFPPEQALIWEEDVQSITADQLTFPLEDHNNVLVMERTALETRWSPIAPVSAIPPRVVFYSIKGGVGRSTALAATAWALAEQGKRVLVLDLDLESPGLSSSLLPTDRQPTYGIVDWLVEDLVDNGSAILGGMMSTSNLSRDGDIIVVPAHGRDAGEYVAKLGRVWMPRVGDSGHREAWHQRLGRLLNTLEADQRPDIVLIDSRSGIDETASVCLTSLGASLILLFAVDGDQTWAGYRMIFHHWLKIGAVRDIRNRLQTVGALIPELGSAEYFDSLRESAWDTFSTELYDEVPAGTMVLLENAWSFDKGDEAGPHTPWPIRWHRSFASLTSIHSRLSAIDPVEITRVFGGLIDGVSRSINTGLEGS